MMDYCSLSPSTRRSMVGSAALARATAQRQVGDDRATIWAGASFTEEL